MYCGKWTPWLEVTFFHVSSEIGYASMFAAGGDTVAITKSPNAWWREEW